ncbi:MAG: hypothetical protein NT157_02080 [Candidatus Micrarchaeota archaeon]|nr:hypothetical protein [Candidatus Micrarchaeota archaeon]
MADKLEEAFGITTKLLFGKQLEPLAKYDDWLKRRVPSGGVVKSAIGSGSVYLPDYGFFRKIPVERAVSIEESERASQKMAGRMGEDATLASIAGELKNFAYFVPTFVEGRNLDVKNTAVYLDCINVRDSFDPFTSKNCARVFSIMDSECLFGAYRTTKSGFSIHCYNCVKVERCFEMDSAINCTDSMFCHNCENLSNCMFCFNAKSKSYAVGNVEVGREKYLEIRRMVVGCLVGELEKKGGLDFDIYNVLAVRRRKRETA